MYSNSTSHLDMQLILELQPDQLITMTRLDINLTPKISLLHLSLFYYSQLKMNGDSLFLTPGLKVDTIRTPDLHMYSHLDPKAHAANGLIS